MMSDEERRKSLLIEIDQLKEDLRVALRQLVEDAEMHARWLKLDWVKHPVRDASLGVFALFPTDLDDG